MSDSVTTFYDNLAEAYRYIFPNWHSSIARQGKILHLLLQAQGFTADEHTIYDCTCGIGTQTFGLALQGWHVHGTDLSPKSIELANEYSAEFDVIYPPTFSVMDLLAPSEKSPTQYDIVMSMDNAVPHFMTDDDLMIALETMKAHLADNGLLMISIRDYDAVRENPPKSTLPSVSDTDAGKHIIFQTWDWADDLSSYKLNMYVTQHIGDTITTQCFHSEYRALQRETMSNALKQIGFSKIIWLMPEESSYYQPIVIARKA